MPKLGNETVKAELGRASWKLLRRSLALPSHSFAADPLLSQTPWPLASQNTLQSRRETPSSRSSTCSRAYTHAVSAFASRSFAEIDLLTLISYR